MKYILEITGNNPRLSLSDIETVEEDLLLLLEGLDLITDEFTKVHLFKGEE